MTGEVTPVIKACCCCCCDDDGVSSIMITVVDDDGGIDCDNATVSIGIVVVVVVVVVVAATFVIDSVGCVITNALAVSDVGSCDRTTTLLLVVAKVDDDTPIGCSMFNKFVGLFIVSFVTSVVRLRCCSTCTGATNERRCCCCCRYCVR